MLKNRGGRLQKGEPGERLPEGLLPAAAPFAIYFLLHGIAVTGVMSEQGEASQAELLSASAVADVCAVVAFLFLWRREQCIRGTQEAKAGGLHGSVWIGALLSSAAVYLLFNRIMTALGIPEQDAAFQASSKEWCELSVLRLLLISTVLAPVTEEFLFRGFLLRRLCPMLSNRSAIFLSAFLFALFHGNWTQGIMAFGMGILLAWVQLRTGCLLLPILMHAGMNALALLFAVTGIADYPAGWMLWVLSALLAPMGIGIVWMQTRDRWDKQSIRKNQKERS